MAISVNDALQLLIDSFPIGSRDLYNLEGDIGKFLTAIATAQKTYLYDGMDTLQLESNPQTITEKIVDWEGVCGFSQTQLAQTGTTNQRRAQIISKLREFGTFSFNDVRAVLQPFFQYADFTQIQINEPDRAALRTAHTYDGGTFNTALGLTSGLIILTDDNFLPVPLQLLFSSSVALTSIRLTLLTPASEIVVETRIFSIDANTTYTVWSTVTKSILGIWTLFVEVPVNTNISWKIFVEGLGKDVNGNEQAGANMFVFGVVADTALLGPNYDYQAAVAALNRITPAHLQGLIVIKNGPTICAFPDLPTTLPDETVPC